MSDKSGFESGFDSDALRSPRRVAFITRKTSAKVKGETGPKLMSYPHLVLREFIVFQVLTILLVVAALFWDAPLEQQANPLLTPNPAKAPWYFIGLQELLHYFPPVVAGVLIPTLVVIALIVIPYFEINTRDEPLWSGNQRRRFRIVVVTLAILFVFLGIYRAWSVIVPSILVAAPALAGFFVPAGRARGFDYLRSRPLSWWVMTWFISVALNLTIVGQFFRGPGWSWVWFWR